MSLKVVKAKSIAQQIADKVGGTWKPVRMGFGWGYESDDGRMAWWCSQLGGPNGDDHMGSQLYAYGPNGGTFITGSFK